MPARLFISHSSRDSAEAGALVAALEALGVACWISGRDIAPGANYQSAIVAAIEAASGLVLLLSAAANASGEVKKELSLASSLGCAVYPVRLGGAQPDAALRYELATRQWIDWESPADVARRLLASAGGMVTEVPALPEAPSVAVLPFENLSGDPEQAYFADGMVEEITTALAGVAGLFVIGRGSAFSYRGRGVDARTIGRELGVRYLAEGSVRRAGGQVRIACRLIEAATGAQLWTGRFDDTTGDIFALQDRVAEAVAGAIEPSLRKAETDRVLRTPLASQTAYDLYLRARHHTERNTRHDSDEAWRLFQAAIARDPQLAVAQGAAAWGVCFAINSGYLDPDDPRRQEGIRLAHSALAGAGDDATTLVLAGFALGYLSRQPALGLPPLDRAVTLAPTLALAWSRWGWLKLYCGAWQDGRDDLRRAQLLSPRDPLYGANLTGLAVAESELGSLEAALGLIQQANAMTPGDGRWIAIETHILVRLGRVGEARALVQSALERDPRRSIDWLRRKVAPFPTDYLERRLAAYRQAGLPDEPAQP